MGAFYLCSVCCTGISIWGVIQLIAMGMFYHIEATPLLDDVKAQRGEYTDLTEFILKTKENYAAQASNCWAVAGIYFVTLVISLCCLRRANRKEEIAAMRRDDDEYNCKKDELPRLA